MNKKEVIRLMLAGKKVIHESWPSHHFMCFDVYIFRNHLKEECNINLFQDEGWKLYEEPPTAEAPEHIDIGVKDHLGLKCAGNLLGQALGQSIAQHGTRYFATCYKYHNGESEDLFSLLCPTLISGTDCFPSHVRFVREDLLGGIPK